MSQIGCLTWTDRFCELILNLYVQDILLHSLFMAPLNLVSIILDLIYLKQNVATDYATVVGYLSTASSCFAKCFNCLSI